MLFRLILRKPEARCLSCGLRCAAALATLLLAANPARPGLWSTNSQPLGRYAYEGITITPQSGPNLAGESARPYMPAKLAAYVNRPAFRDHFDVGHWLTPIDLQADFDGDGVSDYALLATRRSDGKKGIAVWLSTRRGLPPILVGAGHRDPVGSGESDNWNFFDIWGVYKKEGAPTPTADDEPFPSLIGKAILIEKSESASGIVYWDGKRFRWYQLGD